MRFTSVVCPLLFVLYRWSNRCKEHHGENPIGLCQVGSHEGSASQPARCVGFRVFHHSHSCCGVWLPFPHLLGVVFVFGGRGVDARIVVVDALVTSVMCAMFHDFCFRGGRCPRTRRRWPCRWENDCGGWCTARCGRAMRAGCGSGRGGGRAQTRLGQCISPGRCVHGRVAASCESYAVFSSVRAGLYSAACNVGGWADVPS